VVGSHGDAVKIRVAAPPVDGVANAELVRFLAAQLNIPAARVAIVGGASGRRKTVAVEGMETDQIRRALLDTRAGGRSETSQGPHQPGGGDPGVGAAGKKVFGAWGMMLGFIAGGFAAWWVVRRFFDMQTSDVRCDV
jgi:uncharacterized protein